MRRKSLSRFGNQVPLHELLVERDAETGAVGDSDETVFVGLNSFEGQIVAHRDVFDAVLEDEGVAAGAQPVEAGGDGDRACVTVVAESGTDLFNSLADVVGVSETVA